MSLDKTRLREQLVLLEVADAQLINIDPARYLAAAREVRRTIACELGSLPMKSFINDELRALEETAQNVYFDSRRRFADLDGTGAAVKAQRAADRLLDRVRRAG